jgi:hypothetical protein
MKTSLLSLAIAPLAAAGLIPRHEPTTITVTAPASATPTPWAWNSGATQEVPIHPSCNATQTTLLREGLDEAIALSEHARQHILRWGAASEFYVKYFGTAPTAEVLGW